VNPYALPAPLDPATLDAATLREVARALDERLQAVAAFGTCPACGHAELHRRLNRGTAVRERAQPERALPHARAPRELALADPAGARKALGRSFQRARGDR